ncbi:MULTISPECIES: keywimysin-related RiPP [unclassified Streptomyces]|uniref:keywimysin-related RiPP n=1 Tax=unclassified Streptomyces TaxID=2593676 RepID=UPI00278BB424|nr:MULTISPECIES: keywimysin-related RiPP [unclassified Streptomyces]
MTQQSQPQPRSADRRKAYAKPAMFQQGDFTKTTGGYFYGAYKEWIVRRFT